jgi:hypothetical protein
MASFTDFHMLGSMALEAVLMLALLVASVSANKRVSIFSSMMAVRSRAVRWACGCVSWAVFYRSARLGNSKLWGIWRVNLTV